MTKSRCVADIVCREIAIPFRQAFRHASAVREQAAGLWVTATGVDGMVGYGEGCPREYVTGESLSGAMTFIRDRRASIMATVHDLPSLKVWMSGHAREIDRNPAAWCAVELALLDLLSKQAGVPVERYLGLPRLGDRFAYSAVIGVGGPRQSAAMLAQYQKLGMADFKIKVAGDRSVDGQLIELLRAATPKRVRADANNLWSDLEVARAYLVGLDYPFFAIEEPFQPGRYDLMRLLGEALSARIILDESALRVEHLEPLSETPDRWCVNVRVSKMGGLLRSLQFVESCRAVGIAVIVGAQVGETSLLTRAALTVADAAREILMGQEGAFGTYLLEFDPCEPELKFSAKGVLEVSEYALSEQPGFGLVVREPR